MTFKVLLRLMNSFDMLIKFHTVKNTWSTKVTFLHRFVPNSFR